MYKNYEIIKEQELKDINSFGTLLKHKKSGARIFLIKNDDENKSFCIGFRTPPYDDTGLPHILEHSVLCGSRKFPVKEPFVELMKSSLNTFLNAMTFPDKTIYPVASCNDKDFRNLIDVYMDAVLYPNIHSKEEIFKQEGWHYELESKDDEIIYNGVVYNEMKGAFSSPDAILERESNHSLFPDTAYGVESGGDPEFIPTLSYENFKEFHKKYYHPSNSYITIYGNCDMDDLLKWLDEEYLSNFDKIDIDSSITIQKPFVNMKEKKVLYPVTEEQGVENKALLSYNVALPANINNEELMAFDILAQVLLLSAGAPLKKALLNNNIGDVITGSFDNSILQPVFSIIAKNANEEDKDRFVCQIEKCLQEFVNKGIDKNILEAAINNYEFKIREADFGGASKGIVYTINCLNTWLYDDNNPFTSFDFSKAFNILKGNINNNYFENLIKKYLLNNNHKTVIICAPSIEFQTLKENKIKEELLKFKQSLSDKEIEQIIESTKALKNYQASLDTKKNLDTIPSLKKEDIPVDVAPISNELQIIENVKVLWHNFPTNKIAYMRLLFNIKNISSELVPYLGFFTKLFATLDTDKHSYETLEQEILSNTGGISGGIISPVSNVECKSYFLVTASCLYNKIEYVLDLIKEICLSTNYDMKSRIKEILDMSLNSMQQSFVNNGHVKSLVRSLSYTEENQYYTDIVNGVSYYELLSEILKDYDSKYDELVLILKQLSKQILNKENLILSFTGTADGYEEFVKYASTFINYLPNKHERKIGFKFKEDKKNEAFKAPIDVQFVALTGNYKKAGLPYTGALKVFENIISTDYLWQNVRVLGGAYGCMCEFSDNGSSYFVSYRDPNLEKTYDVYKGVVKYLKRFKATEEEMLKFIIGAVGNYDFPKSPSNKGFRSLVAFLTNKTIDDFKFEKYQIINTKVNDIKNIAAYVEAIILQNNICVIGNENKINEASNLFKVCKPLFK